ncbi:MAG: hypothetical protein NC117_06930 [Pseudoflavonifractor sp.]|nr:hypothetical protein [Pseudoflavonifractor sp.]
MKTDELNLTIEELDELCRLYMDCKLSVLEEKELEYILTHTSMTSEQIAEVRVLMSIPSLPQTHEPIHKTKFWNWRYVSGIAASVAILLSVALHYTFSHSAKPSDVNSDVYVVAYSHGARLSDKEAASANNLAMAKADSLMNLASLTEREYMLKANDIINETLNN